MNKFCIFIGPPGAGKGTLSALCSKELGFTQLSTGNLCRQHIAEKTPLGQTIDFAIKSGKLISDDIIIEMVNQWLVQQESNVHTIIFDGFPRTAVQAHVLYDYLSRCFQGVKQHVVHVKVSEQELINRVLLRLVCQNNKCQAVYSYTNQPGLISERPMVCDACGDKLVKRVDDIESVMKDRLIQYYQHEDKLLNFYKSVGVIPYELHGERPLNQVFDELKSIF